ncbi:fasciclin domain-containing protein [Micromonospora endophytica]|uniref:fasciclin domain-containing protein n=1 Tax=Micromonospora endophytica TaxID=515350 RepID=UPI0015E8A116|nr:fasciclin domain-containing protein [Micromonospora endophytica]
METTVIDTLPLTATPARRATTLAGAALAVLIAAAGCTGPDSARDGGTPAVAPRAVSVTGSLCDQLPADGEPGSPDSLVGQPADQALGWIPVLTTFEAAVRATGLAEELTPTADVTILAPTDDAFAAKFSRSHLDELLLHDTDTLRGLLRDHLVSGALPVAELVSAGTVTTLAGTDLAVTAHGDGARLDVRGDGDHADAHAETVCADYRAAGARIHVINQVLGTLPTTAGDEDDHPAH